MKRAVGGLALLALVAGAVLYGMLASERHLFPYRLVRSAYRSMRTAPSPHRFVAPAGGGSRAAREAVAELSQLPYLQGYNPASSRGGVTIYDAARADPGWNLAVSAHGAEALLLDMRGTALHRWGLPAASVWPALRTGRGSEGYDQYWRRAELLPEGDLLVIWEYIGMARIDRKSHLRWALANGAHHDVAVAVDGTILVLTREVKTLPDVSPEEPVFEDFVSVLSPEGKELRRISLLSAFASSDYSGVLTYMRNGGDVLHANNLQVLDGKLADRSPAFRAGNVLVSFRQLNAVAILDPEAQKIVWAQWGPWQAQHATRILANGRLLLFDNFGGTRTAPASRVLELDPFTQEIAWRYGESEAQRIFSESNGGAERLGNGDTLIVESNMGRAFEVTPGGEKVWEYVNPYRAGEKKDLVATLTQLSRLPASLGVDWADHPPKP